MKLLNAALVLLITFLPVTEDLNMTPLLLCDFFQVSRVSLISWVWGPRWNGLYKQKRNQPYGTRLVCKLLGAATAKDLGRARLFPSLNPGLQQAIAWWAPHLRQRPRRGPGYIDGQRQPIRYRQPKYKGKILATGYSKKATEKSDMICLCQYFFNKRAYSLTKPPL